MSDEEIQIQNLEAEVSYLKAKNKQLAAKLSEASVGHKANEFYCQALHGSFTVRLSHMLHKPVMEGVDMPTLRHQLCKLAAADADCLTAELLNRLISGQQGGV